MEAALLLRPPDVGVLPELVSQELGYWYVEHDLRTLFLDLVSLTFFGLQEDDRDLGPASF